ncbi:MAG: cytochrome ubiquinol oxidase subunit I [Spirochaetales bacterium]|nr:MAG: cytochrome ubiquinol oxidase subunit I [Spirochaetales bacterium]
MDVVLLSRIQFAVAAGFHFIFPPLTFGITLVILVLETLYLKSDEEIYKTISSFLIKILGLIFALGVATGIVLEFSFGTNWSQYSRLVGDIFGAPLAAEGILAFFLESVFLGVLLFGRNRVSRKVYWLSAFLVFFGAHLSGFWIIIANSWMQTPAGYVMEGGRAVLTDFYAAVFNPSTVIRFLHTMLAGWITGSLFLAGLAAWYLLNKRHEAISKIIMKISLIIYIFAALAQFVSGHSSSVQVTKTQPEKMAAFEALWNTTEGAPLSLFGIPVESEQKTYLEVSVPKLLSLLAYFDPNAKVLGLNEFKPDERPPVLLPYLTYHVMIALGALFALLAALGALMLVRGTAYTARWFLIALIAAIPLPHLANEFGWIAAEVGRQPWAVYRVLKTADAVSVVVPAWQVLFSLIMFSLIYVLLFIIFIAILLKIVKKGPGTGEAY